MTAENVKEILKAHCNQCGGERRREVLHRETIRCSEDVGGGFEVYWIDCYEMLKCCGCENIALRHQHWFSEITETDGTPVVNTNYYPPAISRKAPRWLNEIDDLLGDDKKIYVASLLKEIYVALYNDARRLAVMGIRALIEQMMIHKVGDSGSFKSNLERFHADGFTSKKQQEVVETILDVGHATIHRAYHPSLEDLNILMDVTESIVEAVYAHEEKTHSLKKRVPKRRKVAKKSPNKRLEGDL